MAINCITSSRKNISEVFVIPQLKKLNSSLNLTIMYCVNIVCRGMAYLHNEPNVIIHRDLKPR